MSLNLTTPHLSTDLPDSNVGNVWTPSWTAKTRMPAEVNVNHLNAVEAVGPRSKLESKQLHVATPTSDTMVKKQELKYIFRLEQILDKAIKHQALFKK